MKQISIIINPFIIIFKKRKEGRKGGRKRGRKEKIERKGEKAGGLEGIRKE